MRLAWCRPATDLSDRLDDTISLIAALRARHEVIDFDESSMHDLVRLAFRQPFDLYIYELADTLEHAFLWPYLLHYPGIVRLRTASLHHSRGSSLARQRRGRDRQVELAFGGGDLSAAPVLASRLVVVADSYQADALQREFPSARVRVAPIGVDAPANVVSPTNEGHLRHLRIGVLGHPMRQTIVNAVRRARDAGTRIDLIADTRPNRVIEEANVVLFVPWPPTSDLTPAIVAFAHGQAVVLFDTESSAGWPTLDPQTWQLRGGSMNAIAITIDPRDEEHSLFLALRRLANDAALRNEIAETARTWWQANSTVPHAVHRWEEILAEAVSISPPPHPIDWPAHLTADGTERARQILSEFAVDVDFLGQ